MSGRVYLDWNASAPLRPEARAAMLAAMDVVGNPSSVHAEGRAARAIVEKARAQVARLTGCAPEEVIFTSGATEAAATVLSQNWDRARSSPIEHDSVHASLSGTAELLPFDGTISGVLEGDAFDAADGERCVLACQAANGETGHRLPYQVLGAAAREQGWHTFVDATQIAGRGDFRFSGELATAEADFACLSAHKLGGPRGTGAILARAGTAVAPLLSGGGQESGQRSGTEDIVGIAGFGAAAEAAAVQVADGVWKRVEKLRNILEERLEATAPDTIFIGRDAPRLPNTACFAVPGWPGETQVMQMDLAGFAVSAGSACSSGKVNRASRVLLAMGFDAVTASSAIRVSMGPVTTEDDVMAFADAWTAAYRRRRYRAA